MSQLKYWNGTAWVTAVVGAQGPTGDTGPSGVIAVTAPITNIGTSTSANIGVDQTALVIAKTQVSGTAVVVADLASASVNFASTAGTAIFATNAGTASYSVASGTAVYANNSGTAVYSTNAGTAVYATNAGTAVYATNAGTAVFANTAGTAAPSAHASTHASDGSDAVTLAQSQVTNLETDLGARPTVETILAFNNQSSTAIEPVSRISISSVAVTAGRINYAFFSPLKNLTVSQITMGSGGTAGVSLTLARMGLHTFDGTTITLVAQTASDTTLFTTAFTNYTRSFNTAGGYPSTYTLLAGQRYALSFIVTGTTMPSIVGNSSFLNVTGLEPRTAALRSSQTDLLVTDTPVNSGLYYWSRVS